MIKLYNRLKPYIFGKHKELAGHPKNHAMLDGWAKEDARYVVSLATEAQLGITLNARNLEFLIRRFESKKLAELREILKTLRPMKSDYAETYADVLETRQWRIFRPYFEKDVQAALKKYGFEPPHGLAELGIGSDWCRVDGVELPQELAGEIRRIFAEYRGVTLRKGEEVIFRYDGKEPAVRRNVPSED